MIIFSNTSAKKGYLLFYNEQEKQWIRRYIVCLKILLLFTSFQFQVVKRPYIFIYNNEKDQVPICCDIYHLTCC